LGIFCRLKNGPIGPLIAITTSLTDHTIKDNILSCSNSAFNETACKIYTINDFTKDIAYYLSIAWAVKKGIKITHWLEKTVNVNGDHFVETVAAPRRLSNGNLNMLVGPLIKTDRLSLEPS